MNSQAVMVGGLLAAMVGGAAAGPLKRYEPNPIWFDDGSGHAVYLAGSHTWATFQERGVAGETPLFDYPAWLDHMTSHGHNFLRMWTWEHALWMQFAPREARCRYEPLPYQRTGPGLANDGLPKFDLTSFNDGFFTRLRERVQAANDRGVYVSVMFFQGFSVEQKGTTGVDPTKGNPWDGHPFNAANNINGIDGDLDRNGEGTETHTLANPDVTRLQEAYVRRIIETVDDLDGIVYEIGNECHPGSVAWHDHFIKFVREVERKLPKQHLVGMTGAPIKNEPMLASVADWISPMGKAYLDDPPVPDGEKLLVVDTDHISPWGYEPAWVWKSFLRGNHVVLMDGYRDYRLGAPARPLPEFEPVRYAMGDAVMVSGRVDLGSLRPRPELAESGYCLADPGREYVVYLPAGGDGWVELPAKGRSWTVDRFDTIERTWSSQRLGGEGRTTFAAGSERPAVLHLRPAG